MNIISFIDCLALSVFAALATLKLAGLALIPWTVVFYPIFAWLIYVVILVIVTIIVVKGRAEK